MNRDHQTQSAWDDIYEGVRFNHADEPLVAAIESARQRLQNERDGYRGALVGLLPLLGTGQADDVIRKRINQALKVVDSTPPATPVEESEADLFGDGQRELTGSLRKGWRVEVSCFDDNIVAIEERIVAGKADLDDDDHATIHHAAMNLLGFVGAAHHPAVSGERQGNYYGHRLTAGVSDGRVVITVGVETLAHAVAYADWANPFDDAADEYIRTFAIADAPQFAKDMVGAMLAEREDGSTPLSEFLDRMALAAVEDGSLGLDDAEYRIKHGEHAPCETWARASTPTPGAPR